MAPGVWFDFSWKEPNAYITRDDVAAAVEQTGVRLQPESVALYYTGWYHKYRSRFEYIRDYPGLDRAATEYLNDLGAISIGADAPSIDSWREVAEVKGPARAHRVSREEDPEHREFGERRYNSSPRVLVRRTALEVSGGNRQPLSQRRPWWKWMRFLISAPLAPCGILNLKEGGKGD